MSFHGVIVNDRFLSPKEQILKEKFFKTNVFLSPQSSTQLLSSPRAIITTPKKKSVVYTKSGIQNREVFNFQAKIIQEQLNLLKSNQESLHLTIEHITKDKAKGPKARIAKSLFEIDQKLKILGNTSEGHVDETKVSTLSHNKPNTKTKFINRKADETIKLAAFKTQTQPIPKIPIVAIEDPLLKISYGAIPNVYSNYEPQEEPYKHIESTISKKLGGFINYDSLLDEVQSINTSKRTLIKEYNKSSPVYPYYPGKIESNTPKGSKKKISYAPIVMPPNKPVTIVKPSNKPAASSKTRSYKQLPNAQKKTILNSPSASKLQKLFSPTAETNDSELAFNHSESNITSPLAQNPLNSLKTSILQLPEKMNPSPASPNYKESHYLMHNGLYSETRTPPKPQLNEKIIDIITEYILTRAITPSKQLPDPELQPSKWIGAKGLNELSRLGANFNPFTVEKVGKEVITEAVSKIRLSQRNSEPIKTEKPGEKISIPRSEPGRIFRKSKESKSFTKSKDFNKGPPMTPQINYEKSLHHPERLSISEIAPGNESNLSSLLNPELLSRMSASSIKHYVSALIDAGHISKQNQTPSFLIRSPEPTPNYNPEARLDQKLAFELNIFLRSPIGSQILAIIEENPEMPPQDVLKAWNAKHQHSMHSEAKLTDIEDKPGSRSNRIFDLEAEERKIVEENSIVRTEVKVPILEIKKIKSMKTEEIGSCGVSDFSNTSSLSSKEVSHELLEGLIEFVRKAREFEQSQLDPGLSEGEVVIGEEGLSSGEIPKEMLSPMIKIVTDRYQDFPAEMNISEEEGEVRPDIIFSP